MPGRQCLLTKSVKFGLERTPAAEGEKGKENGRGGAQSHAKEKYAVVNMIEERGY